MNSAGALLGGVALYMSLLLALAWWAERTAAGQRFADGALVYALALGVYTTSWSYYGSVGVAARSGPLFLAVYLGPTLTFLFAPILLRRIVEFGRKQRTGNIADFVAALYGGSQTLGVVVTLLTMFAVTPYIALQIKSIIGTFSLMVGRAHDNSTGHYADELMIGFLIVVTIVFGLRSLDATRRQRGIVTILAIESLFKLGALTLCGLFAVFGLFDGPGDLLQRFVEAQHNGSISVLYSGGGTWYVSFATWLLLAAAAIFLLPRMFHVMVVENADVDHLRTATWLLPLFLLLMNLFVAPIAAAGLTLGLPSKDADTYVLQLPLQAGADALAFIVFLGGFSAAMGMIIVAALTFSLMISNFLVLPLTGAHPRLAPLARYLRPVRWLAATSIIVAAYLFQKYVGATQFLVAMGLVSFAGFAQLAPAVIGGLFWRGASRRGAIAGIVLGLVVWFYTLFLPQLAHSQFVSQDFMIYGPFGLGWLDPQRLFGLRSLPPLAHGVFWSLLTNISAYVLISTFAPDPHETKEFVDDETTSELDAAATITLAPLRVRLEERFGRFMNAEDSAVHIDEIFARQRLLGAERATPLAVARLLPAAQTTLAGSIGSAAAARLFAGEPLLSPADQRRVRAAYGALIAELDISPDDLRERVDFYQERKALAEQHARELTTQIEQLKREIAARAAAESAQREVESRLRLLTDNAPVLIWMADASGNRDYFNLVWRRFTGLVDEGAAAAGWRDALHADDRQTYLKQHDEGLRRRLPFTLEFRMRRSDGAYRWLREDCVIRFDERGEAIGHLGSAFDITDIHDARQAMIHANEMLESEVAERTSALTATNAELAETVAKLKDLNRKLEEAQNQLLQSEKMASVGQLAAGVAHEINNPVGFINSNLGTLKNQVADLLRVIDAYGKGDALLANAPEIRTAIETAKAQADLDYLREDITALIGESLEGVVRVKKIVQDLKDFSRVDTAEWHFASLENGLDSTLNIVWNELKYKAEVVKEYAGVPEIECIASQLNQVFMNLLVNAAQAIETRGTITLRTGYDAANVWVEIADTGKGIPPENLKRVFEPFFTTKPVGKGTGLGLSLAWSIVQRHHGTLAVDSRTGAGTTFRLTIPRQRTANAPTEEQACRTQ